jgi:hypothetical protein
MTNVEYLLASYGLAWALLMAYVGYLHVRLAGIEVEDTE